MPAANSCKESRVRFACILAMILSPALVTGQNATLDGQKLIILEAKENPKAVGLYVQHDPKVTSCTHNRVLSQSHLGSRPQGDAKSRFSNDWVFEYSQKELAKLDLSRTVLQGLTGELMGLEFRNEAVDGKHTDSSWVPVDEKGYSAALEKAKEIGTIDRKRYARWHTGWRSFWHDPARSECKWMSFLRIKSCPNPNLTGLIVVYADLPGGKRGLTLAKTIDNEVILGKLAYKDMTVLDLGTDQVTRMIHPQMDTNWKIAGRHTCVITKWKDVMGK